MAHPGQNTLNWQPQENQNWQGVEQRHERVPFPSVLSAEEMRTLKECNRESFYYRCIPLSAVLSGLAYFGMKNGFIAKSAKYGYTPKILLCLFLGYSGGKISYRRECMEKILRLPNSHLADVIRKNKGLPTLSDSLATDGSFMPGTGSPPPSGGDLAPGLVLEERKPDFSEHNDGIESYDKVAESLSPYTEIETKSERNYTTYDDLRRANREEYNSRMAERYRRQTPEPSRPSVSSTPPSTSHPESPFGSMDLSPSSGSAQPRPEPYLNPKRNKYGDLWDD